jgi:hypothetical protein
MMTATSPDWAEVETGFHVASRAGEFLGYVDTSVDGGYLAFDGRSMLVGRFDALADAKTAASGDLAPTL